eukprot:CAMPEP_0197514802 /NCGR_PEP_ID=MMETSP1318-20131121/132_1 /TAXON_ID=552666 /ORGANISM="Partenskyella glossopodia, Strain RCC365" /LENGTH=121 /DNA_ID=CAMNT_0043062997 /DNA_START=17 /DNA_END=382 /DNA_ORIENTATION=+
MAGGGLAFRYFLSNLLIKILTLCGGYKSYEACKSEEPEKMKTWLHFWIVFTVWTFLSVFLDSMLYYIVPLYPELRVAFVAFLAFGEGAKKIYEPHMEDLITKAEKLIKEKIAELKPKEAQE